MDNAITGFNIGSDDFGHRTTGVASTFLVDLLATADGAACIAIGHMSQARAVQVFSIQHMIGNSVKEKDISQRRNVVQQGLDGARREIVESGVVGGKNSEVVFAQWTVQASSLDSCTESFKAFCSAGNPGDGCAIMSIRVDTVGQQSRCKEKTARWTEDEGG